MENDLLTLEKIYQAISCNDEPDIDNDCCIEKVYGYIEECFDTSTKQQDEKVFKNTEYTNTLFIKLLKFCGSKNYKQSPIIFIVFCDYFGLAYDDTYNMFHDKLKLLVKTQSVNYISKSVFMKYMRKTQTGYRILTLNEL